MAAFSKVQMLATSTLSGLGIGAAAEKKLKGGAVSLEAIFDWPGMPSGRVEPSLGLQAQQALCQLDSLHITSQVR